MAAWVWWMWGGTEEWMVRWMRGPGPLLLMLSPLAEFAFCAAARIRFNPNQHSRRTWTYLASAALSRFLGTLIAQWLPAIGLLEFVQNTPQFGDLRWVGYSLSGSVAVVFYLLGLRSALRTYRRFGNLPPLRFYYRLVLGAAAAFVGQQLVVLVREHRDQLAHPSNWLNWATDPLLLVLLYLSLRLCSASGAEKGGLLGRVWLSYAAGFALMLVGDCGNWIINMGYLSWIAASPVAWFVWYPASAALASGACSQWQASMLARRASLLSETARFFRPSA